MICDFEENPRVKMGLNLESLRIQDKDLRILICTATYFVQDGVTLTIRRLEGHLKNIGATVKILTTVPENIDPELISNIIVVPGIKIPFTHAGDYSFGIGLDENTIKQIEEYKPNIVHFTVPDFVGLDGVKWCQKNNIAYMGTWHSNYTDYLKYYYLEWILSYGFHQYLKGFYEQIPTVYIPTPYMLQKVRDEWKYGTCTELKEWGRGVDMGIFNPARRSQTFRAKHGIAEDDVVVLWVGRLVPEKRPDIWMDTVKRLQDEGLPVKSLVVGNGTYEKTLSKLKHVVCLGWLSGAALGAAYASSDILLFPSDVETFGNVTLEALSAGCPAIVESKCGGHLVEHNVNGLTCECGDGDAFYQATRKLVVETVLREEMGVRARENARKFDRNVILQQMAENYKDAIAKHSDPNFLKKYMSVPEARGNNTLAFLCCNFSLLKMIVEPFLHTVRGVQDGAECTSDCVVNTRTRLSCNDFAAVNSTTDIKMHGDEDVESQNRASTTGSSGSSSSTNISHNTISSTANHSTKVKTCSDRIKAIVFSTASYASLRVLYFVLLASIVFMFIYASFSV